MKFVFNPSCNVELDAAKADRSGSKSSLTKNNSEGEVPMNLRAIIVANAVSVALLLIMLFAARTKITRDHVEDKLFAFIVFGVMLGSVFEALSYLLDGKLFPGARVLNYALNTYLFSANMLLPFFLLVYVDLSLYGKLNRIWKKYKIHIIIGALMVLVNVVNYFVPISYVITAGNVYERRPFSYAYYVVIVFYLVSIFFVLQNYKKQNGARAFINFWMFLVPVITGTGLQFLIYGLSLAWLSSSVGLVGLFMMQQNELAYIDPLVKTYNRQYLDHILASWISKGRSFTGIMLDIDRFKDINDNFGHSEGDKALKTLTDILRQSCANDERLFRFAGDEFIVLKLTTSPNGLDGFIAEVNKRIAEFNAQAHPYRFSLSYGTAYFVCGSADTFLKQMDERMYQMKSSHHDEIITNVKPSEWN